MMWCVLSDSGELLKSFPAGHKGWDDAVRWARMNGGELDVVLLEHVRPGWTTVSGGRFRWFDEEAA